MREMAKSWAWDLGAWVRIQAQYSSFHSLNGDSIHIRFPVLAPVSATVLLGGLSL